MCVGLRVSGRHFILSNINKKKASINETALQSKDNFNDKKHEVEEEK